MYPLPVLYFGVDEELLMHEWEFLVPDQGHPVMLLEGRGRLGAAHAFSVFHSWGIANSCHSFSLKRLFWALLFPLQKDEKPIDTELCPLGTLKLNNFIHPVDIYWASC